MPDRWMAGPRGCGCVVAADQFSGKQRVQRRPTRKADDAWRVIHLRRGRSPALVEIRASSFASESSRLPAAAAPNSRNTPVGVERAHRTRAAAAGRAQCPARVHRRRDDLSRRSASGGVLAPIRVAMRDGQCLPHRVILAKAGVMSRTPWPRWCRPHLPTPGARGATPPAPCRARA